MGWKETVLAEYPSAQRGEEVSNHYLNLLRQEHGIDPAKTLLASCICSDDVNADALGFSKHYYGPFFMGGLAAFPHTGLTGICAFGHHVPDHGAALIVYASHIGISKSGELGKMHRFGQAKESSSCGALMLALGALETSGDVPSCCSSTNSDFQKNQVIAELIPYRERILGANNPKKEITEVAYEIIHRDIKKLVVAGAHEIHAEKIVLLGGIMINTDSQEGNWFEMRNFEVIAQGH